MNPRSTAAARLKWGRFLPHQGGNVDQGGADVDLIFAKWAFNNVPREGTKDKGSRGSR